MRKKIVNLNKCTGCRNCELACIAAHSEDGSMMNVYKNGTAKAARPRNKVEKGKNGKPFPQFCRHCDEPACVEACMSGALTKDEQGIVTCDPDICVGCFMCVMSCPYGMARPDSSGGDTMVKCDMCRDRDTMACAAACPVKCIEAIEEADEALEILIANEET